MNLFVIFLTGLTTGGLSCVAMQGGLLAGVIANQKEVEKGKSKKTFDKLDWLPVTSFLTSKLVAHILLGFLLGSLGAALSLSLGMRLAFQLFAALFMFATAMNLLDVHPAFRYLAFQPPRFLQKLVRSSSKSRALFAPAILGFLTIFIPCGVTQAMEVLAINVGNPIQGALIMGSFVLGTIPLFAFVGVATARLSETWHQVFTRFAATVLILMSIYSVNGVLIVINSPITVNKIARPVTWFFSEERFEKYSDSNTAATNTEGEQVVTISINNHGYEPRKVTVKKDLPVKLVLQSDGAYSCALSFVFKEFGIVTNLEPTDTQVFTFTPTEKGRFTYTCSMGMYSGVMEVI